MFGVLSTDAKVVQEKPVPFAVARVDQSRYAVFSVPIQEGGEVIVTCRRAAAK